MAKKYIIYRSIEYNLYNKDVVEDYFFYIFNIFKKTDYETDYLNYLKLLSIKAYIIKRFED